MIEGNGNRAATGVPGLDYVLDGGLPIERLYLIQGAPGAGKTTMAMQFLLEGARRGEPGVYASLSETEEELRDIAVSHGWQLDGIAICDLQSTQEELRSESQYTIFHQHGLVGSIVESPIELSYLADNVILLRYFEAFGEIRQAISVVKKRNGSHERTIRELRLGPKGPRIGEVLADFHGVLGGDLTYVGGKGPLLGERSGLGAG